MWLLSLTLAATQLLLSAAPPVITAVSPILPQQVQTITITGSGFGAMGAYSGDSYYIAITDESAGWNAGYSGDSPADFVTLGIGSWTDTQITVTGFLGQYGNSSQNWILYDGDQVLVRVWNAQTGAGPATATVTVGESGLILGAGVVGSCSCAEPIDIASGNVFEQITDYSTTGQNRLAFTRYYNSLANALPITTLAGTLGTNWRSSFDRYLQLPSSTTAIVERPDGQQVTFTLINGAWTTDGDLDFTLTSTGSVWTFTDNNDTVETYSASGVAGRLQSIKWRNGYTQHLNYNSNNQLLLVTDSYNRMLSLTYSKNLLQNLATPDGLTLTYSFNSLSSGAQLTKVAYSTMPATSLSYVYENSSLPFALTGVIDENGNRYATWSYNGTKRAVSNQLANGANATSLTYNSDGSRTVTNALGQQLTYKFAMVQGVSKVVEIDRAATSTTAAAKKLFAYDANGYPASRTDWNGNLTNYVNDIHGQPTTITEAVGTPSARTTTITYDSTFVHLPKQIVTPGLTTGFTYDSAGEVLTRTLTDTTTGTVPYATSGQTRVWAYAWSSFLLASVLGPRTDAQALTKFNYDSTGALTGTTNALGQITRITQHTLGGLPQTIVDANGVTTNLTYDSRLRLLTSAVTTVAGVLTTKFTYDAAGNLLTTTLPDGSALTSSYDNAHRLTGIGDLLKQSIAYTLDALGDRTKTNILDANGKIQRTHSGSFDALGRILQDVGGVGQTTTLAHDANGNTLSVTDPLKNAMAHSFDALNRPAATTNAAGNVTTTTYDTHDRPLTVTDANGGTTKYAYDGFGDLIQQTSPVTGTTVYWYDSAGNLKQRSDARGVVTNNAYDALDRITSTTYPNGASENVAYSYDQSGHGFGIGRLTAVMDAVGTLSRSYDERGDLTAETRTIGKTSLVTSYTYDAAQRVASLTFPSGWSAVYARDVMGRVTGVSAQAPGTSSKPTPIISGIVYQPFGPANAATYGNSVAEARTFDTDYRLTGLTDAGKTSLQNLTYGFDAANNVLSIKDGVTSGNSQAFGYDVLNRLTSATGAYGKLAYQYDAIGNRLADAAPTTNPPDGLGNTTAITYNQSGRIAAVTAGTQQISGYLYDAFSKRISRTGTNSGFYQYDQTGRLIEETDGQGNPQADYVYLGDQPVASVSASSGKVYFLHDDRLGTPQLATDAIQTIQWSAAYQPFGGTSTGVSLITQDLRLPGQEYDSVAGWNHNGFREYAPSWGRYSQGDPSGLAGGTNRYSYASGNPEKYMDPSGLIEIFIGGAGDNTKGAVKNYFDQYHQSNPNSRYFNWDQGSDIQNLINSISPDEPITLIGHSWGADTASKLVLANPGMIDTLITIDPVSWNTPSYVNIDRLVGTWIDVDAHSTDPLQISNVIAWLGSDWGMGPNGIAETFIYMQANHADFPSLFGAARSQCP
jgi:RHS repeat-associated protein